tara:strand:+ start:568 stop:2778 length:2211 start_codon:yes stop_codon:yes gene_type:complete
MGGVFGHMSHIYDNPNMTFGQIKDILTKASDGQLENVTEKTDGQNLFVSYNVQDGTVRAARNKSNLKAGGMDAEALAEKFGGRGALTDAFVNAFKAFDLAVQQFSDEEKLELFGPDTNIFYNAEVMDPANANVINYDTKTFLIHRAGHAEFDRETGRPIPRDKDFSEQQAAKLQAALENAQERMEGNDFSVQVNAIRQLEKLSDGGALNSALAGIDRAMAEFNLSDDDTIADYIFTRWKSLVESTIPELTPDQEKLIIDRVMTDYYGALDGEGPLKSRGLETRQIKKAIGRPDLNEAVLSLIKNYPRYFKEFIFPIESIIHRFAIQVLAAVQSAYIVAAGGNEKEVARLQALVGKAIDTINSSGNEEAMEIIKNQVEKLSQLENDGSIGNVDLSMISSAAEGIVFDYDGHTYKFTGGFAPANQILGLFKYGRKGIPAFDDSLDESAGKLIKKLPKMISKAANIAKPLGKLAEEEDTERVIAIYPGRFQPMGRHHFQTFQAIADQFGLENTFIATSGKTGPKSPLSFEEKKAIMMAHGVPASQIVETRNPYQATEVTQMFDPTGTSVVFAVGGKDMKESPRFSNLDGLTKKGTPAYYKTFRPGQEMQSLDKHGYMMVAPHVEIDVPGYGEMSGTTLRKALKTATPEEFEILMGWFNQEIYDILQGKLDEMSSMGGGNIQGAMIGTGSKKGPWHGFDAEAFNRRQKKDATLRGAKEFLSEEDVIVNEVVDYLLGITVG